MAFVFYAASVNGWGVLSEINGDFVLVFGLVAVINRIGTAWIATRQKVSVWNFIARWVCSVILGVVLFFVAVAFGSSKGLGKNTLACIIVGGLWLYLAILEPVIAILRLSRLTRCYKENLCHKQAAKYGVRPRPSAPGRSVGGYGFGGGYGVGGGYGFGSDYDSDSGYSKSDSYNDYDYDLPDAYDSYNDYSSYDYSSYESYYDSSADDKWDSYESYKESENYYTSDDSYAIYESYYDG